MPFGYEGWALEGREPAKIGSATLLADLIEHYGLAKFCDDSRNILTVNKKVLQVRMEQLLPRSAAAAAPATAATVQPSTFVHRPRPAPCGRPIPRPDGIMIPHQGRDRKCAKWSTQAGLCIKTGCASSCPKVFRQRGSLLRWKTLAPGFMVESSASGHKSMGRLRGTAKTNNF